MELEDKIAIMAVALSFLSLVISLLGYLLSIKALRLTEQERSDKFLGIKSYLIDGFTFSENEKKYCEFAISITNLSSSTKSFQHVELHIEYVLDDGMCGKAIFQPITNVNPPNIQKDYKKINLPLNIQPKESISGWVTFPRPDDKNTDIRIKEYKIVGICNELTTDIVTAYLLRFINNEKSQD